MRRGLVGSRPQNFSKTVRGELRNSFALCKKISKTVRGEHGTVTLGTVALGVKTSQSAAPVAGRGASRGGP